MKEVKSYFTVDSRLEDSFWVLIDTDMTLRSKAYHMACISCHSGLISSFYNDGFDKNNSKYIKGIDDRFGKPTISDYIGASDVLREHGIVYNKKKGTLIKVKSLSE